MLQFSNKKSKKILSAWLCIPLLSLHPPFKNTIGVIASTLGKSLDRSSISQLILKEATEKVYD